MKRGRRSKITPTLESVILKLAEQGKVDREVAEIISVSESALHEHKKRNPEFHDSLKKAKADFDDSIVEQALLKRAIGMTVKEVQVREVDGKKVTTETLKELPPDATSLALWLRNRKPNEWCREKNNLNLEIESQRGLTREEALQIMKNDPFAGPSEEVEFDKPSWLSKG